MLPKKSSRSNTPTPASGILTSPSLRGLVASSRATCTVHHRGVLGVVNASSFLSFAISLSSSLFSYSGSLNLIWEWGTWCCGRGEGSCRQLRLNFLILAESSRHLHWMRPWVWNEYLLALWRILKENTASKFVGLGLIEAPSLLFMKSREDL